MGLDTTHGAWHGSYTSFHRFRDAVAKQIGINLEEMEGFGGERPWHEIKEEPLVIFLNQSDCEGEIRWQDCGAIAKRLREVAPKLAGEIWRTSAERFAAGCEKAAAAKEDLEFR